MVVLRRAFAHLPSSSEILQLIFFNEEKNNDNSHCSQQSRDVAVPYFAAQVCHFPVPQFNRNCDSGFRDHVKCPRGGTCCVAVAGAAVGVDVGVVVIVVR